MAVGIVTATIPPLRVTLAGERLDDDTLYRALFSFYDPLLRASLLVNDVLPLGEPARLPSRPQDLSCGTTYHFLHGSLRHVALQAFVQKLRFSDDPYFTLSRRGIVPTPTPSP